MEVKNMNSCNWKNIVMSNQTRKKNHIFLSLPSTPGGILQNAKGLLLKTEGQSKSKTSLALNYESNLALNSH